MLPARPFGTALLVVLPALSPGTGAAAQGILDDRESRFSFGGVAFPAVADSFVVLRVSRWPNLRLGVGLQYSSPTDPSGNFDVYVYPSDDRDLEGEFRTAVEDILRYAKENREGVTATVDTTYAITILDDSGRAYDGWAATAAFDRSGNRRPSLLYVFEKDGRFIKYRLTHAASLRVRLAPRLERFLAETLAGIGAAGS